jgi:hypothetical protein
MRKSKNSMGSVSSIEDGRGSGREPKSRRLSSRPNKYGIHRHSDPEKERSGLKGVKSK